MLPALHPQISQQSEFIRDDYLDEDQQEFVNWLGIFTQLSAEQTLEMKVQDRGRDHLALSPDGSTFAYGGNSVHLINVDSKTEIQSRAVDGGQLMSLAFSPDGKTLAIGTRGKLLLWNWADTKDPRSIAISGNPRFGPPSVDCLAFSPDGATLAVKSGNENGKAAVLLDVATGETLRTFEIPRIERWYLRVLVFSPDGKLLAANIDENEGGGVALWETSTGKLVRRFTGLLGNAYNLAFCATATAWPRPASGTARCACGMSSRGIRLGPTCRGTSGRRTRCAFLTTIGNWRAPATTGRSEFGIWLDRASST